MTTARKKTPLHVKILWALLAGAVLGVLANLMATDNPAFKEGFLDPFLQYVADPVGKAFLAMIFMVVVPLLFSALVLGISEVGDVAKVGRIGVRTLIMTVLFSSIAVLLAFIVVTVAKPGSYISVEKREELLSRYERDGLIKAGLSAEEADEEISRRAEGGQPSQVALPDATAPANPPALGIVPQNPFLEATRALSGGILPFMFFSLVFGIALALTDPDKAAPLKQFLEGVFEVSQKIIQIALYFAPYGVFALMFGSAVILGMDLFVTLGLYALLVLVTLAIHQFGVYSLLLSLIAKKNPLVFFRQMKNVMMTAFATSSSNATLPVALKDATDELHLPKDISTFVLTVGATANQNGTALFEGITIIFLCQLFGIELTVVQTFTVLGLAILAGIGTAGVPGGAWPTIAAIVRNFNVPVGSIGMVLGIDRLLDMSRTVLNVTGDMAIACCVARWEGRPEERPEESFQ